MFLEHQIMKDHVTLKNGVVMLKIQLCTEYIFLKMNYLKIENSHFEL